MQAADVFMEDWINGDRAGSAAVALPGAVATLYANAYRGQPLNDRGCSTAFSPIRCTWGPYAGGSGAIYEIYLLPEGSRWYVSSLSIQS
jgi:hypothetical protein